MSRRVEDRVRVPPGATGLYRAMLVKSASMYSEIQRERPDIGNIMAHPDYIDGNPDLIKPKKLQNPVKASKSHQELHRELLMSHKRSVGTESKPELQRVLEHRRRNQLLRQRKEEEEAKKLRSPFEQELLKRQQRLDQVGAGHAHAAGCVAGSQAPGAASLSSPEQIPQKPAWGFADGRGSTPSSTCSWPGLGEDQRDLAHFPAHPLTHTHHRVGGYSKCNPDI
uniref:Actin-associated protein FAM107A n=1 Tax=Sphenodon punctatus TaxID=8508 RepID=A0A8D0GHT5_SPHPU